MSVRIRIVQELFDQLIGVKPIEEVANIAGHGQMYYIFCAYLMKWFDLQTPEMAFLMAQAIGIGLIFLAFPFSMLYATKSYMVAVASDFILLFTASYLAIEKRDSYWAGYVAIIISLPLLVGLFLASEWKALEWSICIGLVMFFSVCNLPRSQSALPGVVILLALVLWKVIILFKKHKWINAVGIAAVSGICFCLINFSDDLLLNLYHTWEGPLQVDFTDGIPWHAMYVGLGYLENEYNIVFLDGCGYEYARSIDPDVVPESEQYMQIIKERYLSIAFEDPAFFIKVNFAKLWQCALILGSKLAGGIMGLVIIAAALGLAADKKMLLKVYLIILICGALGTVQGVLAVPKSSYITPGIGAIIVLNVYMITDVLKGLCTWMTKAIKRIN